MCVGPAMKIAGTQHRTINRLTRNPFGFLFLCFKKTPWLFGMDINIAGHASIICELYDVSPASDPPVLMRRHLKRW